jgi:hypothetical protein
MRYDESSQHYPHPEDETILPDYVMYPVSL